MSRRQTPYALAVEKLLQQVSLAVFSGAAPASPVVVVVAGGAAVHLYTGSRVSKDLDAEFLARMLRPNVVVAYADTDGTQRTVHLDVAYSSTLGVMHEDYLERAAPSGWTASGFDVRVLAPVDLAISKLGRWAEHDQADVRSLVDAGLLNRDSFERLANEALSYYVGKVTPVRTNLVEALAMFPPPANSSKKGRQP